MSDYLSGKAESQSLSVTGEGNVFVPDVGRPLRCTISGTWAGSVKVQRSYDRGTTWNDMTLAGSPDAVFTGNCDELIDVPMHGSVQYRPHFTRTSGTAVVELGH